MTSGYARLVFEVIVAAVVAGLALAGALAMLASPELLIEYGVIAAVVGTVVGTIVSVVYHAKLWRALATSGSVPRDWLLRPFTYHRRLDVERQALILPWFYVGVTVFIAVAVACTISVVGLVRLLV